MINFNHVLWGLEELADRKQQERLWLDRSIEQASTFEEAVSQTFDDTGLAELLDSTDKKDALPIQLITLLLKLRSELTKIDTEQTLAEIVGDPKMEIVRELSSKAIDAIKDEPRLLDSGTSTSFNDSDKRS